jgi:hypothetical protein
MPCLGCCAGPAGCSRCFSKRLGRRPRRQQDASAAPQVHQLSRSFDTSLVTRPTAMRAGAGPAVPQSGLTGLDSSRAAGAVAMAVGSQSQGPPAGSPGPETPSRAGVEGPISPTESPPGGDDSPLSRGDSSTMRADSSSSRSASSTSRGGSFMSRVDSMTSLAGSSLSGGQSPLAAKLSVSSEPNFTLRGDSLVPGRELPARPSGRSSAYFQQGGGSSGGRWSETRAPSRIRGRSAHRKPPLAPKRSCPIPGSPTATHKTPGSIERPMTVGIESEFTLAPKRPEDSDESKDLASFAIVVAGKYNGQEPRPRIPMRPDLRPYTQNGDYKRWCLVKGGTIWTSNSPCECESIACLSRCHG